MVRYGSDFNDVGTTTHYLVDDSSRCVRMISDVQFSPISGAEKLNDTKRNGSTLKKYSICLECSPTPYFIGYIG